MRRPSLALETLQVSASTGARSSQAQPTPVVRLVAPGPTVETQTPGRPVRYPITEAIKPAEVSLAVKTNSMELRCNDLISGRTGPLGTPKTQRTPAFSSMPTMTSLLFISHSSCRCARDRQHLAARERSTALLTFRFSDFRWEHFRCVSASGQTRLRFRCHDNSA